MSSGRRNSNNNIDWNTPEKIAKKVSDFWVDGIDLDPCTNLNSKVVSKVKYDIVDDGLTKDWGSFKTIFINPPYGRGIKMWFEKAYESSASSEIIILVPVATNTSHWKEYVFGKASVGFIKDSRLKFGIGGSEDNKGAPMACCLIYYGKDKEGFKKHFSDMCNFI